MLDRIRWMICCFIMPRWMLTMIGKSVAALLEQRKKDTTNDR